eukprot:scaffold655_cov105-Isochrysis_galbana.AAC.17
MTAGWHCARARPPPLPAPLASAAAHRATRRTLRPPPRYPPPLPPPWHRRRPRSPARPPCAPLAAPRASRTPPPSARRWSPDEPGRTGSVASEEQGIPHAIRERGGGGLITPHGARATARAPTRPAPAQPANREPSCQQPPRCSRPHLRFLLGGLRVVRYRARVPFLEHGAGGGVVVGGAALAQLPALERHERQELGRRLEPERRRNSTRGGRGAPK